MIGHVVAIARAHAVLAYVMALLLAGSEAFPVAGALIPGTAIIVGLGALIPTGALQFWPLVALVTAGAIAGDALGYWIGYHYKDQAQKHWPLRDRPQLLKRGETFFQKHGVMAIIIARFTPGVRAVVPMIAGISDMKPRRFALLDVVSALLWAPSHILAGVVIGASLTVLGAIAGRLELLIVIVLLIVGLVLWSLPHLVRGMMFFLERQREPVLAWASQKDDWLRRQVRSLLDPTGKELSGLLVLCAALAGSLWLFFGVLQDMIAGDPLVFADHTIFRFLTRLRMDWVTQFAVVILVFGNGIVTIVVAIASLAWLCRAKAWRAAAYSLAAMCGSALFAAGLDLGFQRPAPISSTPVWDLLTFQGSHTAVLASLYSFLAILATAQAKSKVRLIVATATLLFIVLEASARIYLGVDWLSTELAVSAFGVAWAVGLGLAYLARPTETISPMQLVAVTGGALLLVVLPVSVWTHQVDRQRYSVRPVIRVMTYVSWRNTGWEKLPAQRRDLIGFPAQPLDIQWLGSLDVLKTALKRQGWHPAVDWTWRSALSFFASHVDSTTLPTVPQWQDGQATALVMIKTDTASSLSRLVLRLWPSDTQVVSVIGAKRALWIGSVERERFERLYSLVTVPQKSRPDDDEVQRLANLLPDTKMVTRGGQLTLLADTFSEKSRGSSGKVRPRL